VGGVGEFEFLSSMGLQTAALPSPVNGHVGHPVAGPRCGCSSGWRGAAGSAASSRSTTSPGRASACGARAGGGSGHGAAGTGDAGTGT
jgi:hypothetical protein